ncbi:MAG: sulfatase-like hydrolase/transferase [Massilibacteroides sp.]|nr:sulfatase-like hydrolase/transferase [Massilibacteroides sp.]
MNLYCALALGGAMLTSCGVKQEQKKEKAEKPNVILLMADDLGWGSVGFNGNTIIKTPNLDKMANEGVQLNRFYAASAVSSPTRASVLTGRNPYRTGVFTANVGILRTEEVTLPEILKKEGYTTGHFGKWHLGTLTDTQRDANRGRKGNTAEFNPPRLHGYDEAFVSESKVPTWDPMKKPSLTAPKLGWNYIKPGEKFYPFGTHYWDINDNKITENLEGDDSRVIMDRVLPFVEKNIDAKKPFLATVWFHAPHLPCVAGPEYAAMYDGYTDLEKNYFGCITAMDEQVGRLRALLKAKGADENTIICFCSDNGPENGTPGVTGIYKERKRSLHEGGVRVPGIIYYPHLIKKPFKTDFPAVTSDYLPTIARLAGADITKLPYELDGINLVPMLTHKMTQRPSPIVSCIADQISLNGVEYKVYSQKNKWIYYDIVKDPTESNPIAETPELKALREEMDLRMQHYKESFEGKDYGQQSFDRLQQKWQDPKVFVHRISHKK